MAASVHALLFLTIVIWGLAYTAIDQALLEMTPVNLTALRQAVAAATLLAALAAMRRLSWPDRRDWPKLAAMGIVSTITYHVALYAGQLVVPPGTAALLVSSMPVWTAILAAAFLGEVMTGVKVGGIALAMAGVTIVIGWGTPGQELSAVAIENALLILVAPVSWAIFTVLGKTLTGKYDSLHIATWATAVGVGILLAGGVPFFGAELAQETLDLSAIGWGWVLFLGLLSSALTTTIWFYAVGRIGAARAAVYVYAMPVSAILWAAAILGSPITAYVVAGGALIITGIAVTNWPKRTPVAPGPPPASVVQGAQCGPR